ncbi:MAG: preprotein translocase subunit SecD, partial [Halobacteriales archaeon]|nr:preprotein translocase subunit SecD [Halobacteriales archaeon]
MKLRENWRVLALVFLLVLSGIALFAPGGVAAGRETATTGPTNLQYGLELSGGTRIRAPLVGVTAEGVEVQPDQRDAVEEAVADEIEGATPSDVRVRLSERAIEVLIDVDPETVRSAVEAAGYTPESVRRGVTAPTRDTAVEVIRDKIDESGLAGGTVQQVTTSTGDHFIVIEVPNQNRSEVQRLVASRGVVEIIAHFPGDGDSPREEVVLTQDDISNVGNAQGPTQTLNQPFVPVVLTDEAAQEYAAELSEYGFTGPGIQACPSDAPPVGSNQDGYCLYTVLDGQVVYSA